jgi:hypothetical protein
MLLLSELLDEDEETSKQAKQLGLTSKGFGRWADASGKVTHYTKDGKLRKVGSGDLEGPAIRKPDDTEDPPQRRPIRRRDPARNPFTFTPKPIPQQGVSVKSRPTKPDPSFDELRGEAVKYQYTVMSKPLTTIKNATSEQKADFKPRGFWFSVGDQWVDWMSSNMTGWKEDNLYNVEVDESKCIVIDTKEKLIEFDRAYGVGDTYSRYIDWAAVTSSGYSGIIMKKYFYNLRNTYMWYGTWDVASGAVWKTDAITNIEQISIK